MSQRSTSVNDMAPAVEPKRSPPTRSDLGELGWFVALFAAYLIFDLGTRLLSQIDLTLLRGPVLLVSAVRSQPLAFIAAGVALGLTGWRAKGRLLARWPDLDRGRVLRLLIAPVLVMLAWQGALHDYNFFLAQSFIADRLLIIVLALGSVSYPVLLGPFALQIRVMNTQFDQPFGTSSAQNIEDMLVMVLLAVAAVHLVYVVSGRNDSSPTLPLVGAVLAAHYFTPGRTKALTGWLSINQIDNLPLSSYTAGWLGHTGGEWAGTVSDLLRTFRVPVLVGTLIVELGSIIAAAHHRLMRLWLPMAIVFHITLFALTGFWFLSWIVFEATLLILLWNKDTSRWLSHRWTPTRGLVVVLAVGLLGAFLFHPPRLTWLDAPVSYGYRIIAAGESGDSYAVPASNFSPLEQDITFGHIPLGDRLPLSGGYGYLGMDADRYRTLLDLDSLEDVLDLEETRDPSSDESIQYLEAFARYANTAGPNLWAGLAPPDHFWTSGPEPVYRFQEPITSIDVILVTSLHQSGEPVWDKETVLSLQVAPDGEATVMTDG